MAGVSLLNVAYPALEMLELLHYRVISFRLISSNKCASKEAGVDFVNTSLEHNTNSRARLYSRSSFTQLRRISSIKILHVKALGSAKTGLQQTTIGNSFMRLAKQAKETQVMSQIGKQPIQSSNSNKNASTMVGAGSSPTKLGQTTIKCAGKSSHIVLLQHSLVQITSVKVPGSGRTSLECHTEHLERTSNEERCKELYHKSTRTKADQTTKMTCKYIHDLLRAHRGQLRNMF